MNARATWGKANDDFVEAGLSVLRSALKKKRREKSFSFSGMRDAPGPESKHRPALHILSKALGLTEFEAAVLFLSCACEFDPDMAARLAEANGNPARSHATFGLAFQLFGAPAWDAMSPERPLRHWRLLEISQPGVQALTASAIKADERIANYLKGLNYLDDRIAALTTPLKGNTPALAASQAAIVEAIIGRLRSGPPLPVIQLAGVDGSSKQDVATAVAASFGLTLQHISSDQIPADLDTFTRLWQREQALLPLALVVDCRRHEPDQAAMKQVERLATRLGGLLFLDVREGLPDLVATTDCFDIEKPTPEEQASLWRSAMPDNETDLAERIAGSFNLSSADISAAARYFKPEGDASQAAAQVWNACLRRSQPSLDKLGSRVAVKADWDALVLPQQETSQLRQIVAQVKERNRVYDNWGFRARMNRGLGISVLFAGESGTGKTMAAEVIANELGLSLYRIDLSGVVNKYIGETEKNLRKVFDAAEDGGVILFFDEADALFGSRSEVKDAHDRYANIEVNYLLQRIESYSGLAILATNMKKAIDQAFLRRLRFLVNFPHPGIAEREIMWAKAFPPQTPVVGLDAQRLARLNLTGGSIANVTLNAAFRASHAGTPVSMQIIMEAARAEFRKLERPVNEADFRLINEVRVNP